MSKKITLRKEKILDSWSVLIDGAQGKGQEVLSEVDRLIREDGISELKTELVRVYPHEAPILFGHVPKWAERFARDYLKVSDETHGGKVNIYVGAQDYGRNLYVSWHLICEPSIFDRLSAAIEGTLES